MFSEGWVPQCMSDWAFPGFNDSVGRKLSLLPSVSVEVGDGALTCYLKAVA